MNLIFFLDWATEIASDIFRWGTWLLCHYAAQSEVLLDANVKAAHVHGAAVINGASINN